MSKAYTWRVILRRTYLEYFIGKLTRNSQVLLLWVVISVCEAACKTVPQAKAGEESLQVVRPRRKEAPKR